MATEKPFSITQNQKSGIQTGVLSAASIVSLIALARAFGVEPWPPEQDIEMATKIAGGIYVIGHVYGSVVNWFKNRKRPIVTTMGLPLLLLCAALALQGCASTGVGLGKSTKGQQEFIEETPAVYDADGNMTNPAVRTIWRNTFEVPPGGDSSQVAGMEYQGDGWKLKISGNSAIDSTNQAATIQAIAQMQTNALVTGMQIGGGIVSAAVPVAGGLIGQHMDLQAAQAQANLLSRDANLAQIYPMIGQGLQQGQADSQANIEKLLPSLIQRMDRQDSLIEQIMTFITTPPPPPATVEPGTP